jgi:hypothetical protein
VMRDGLGYELRKGVVAHGSKTFLKFTRRMQLLNPRLHIVRRPFQLRRVLISLPQRQHFLAPARLQHMRVTYAVRLHIKHADFDLHMIRFSSQNKRIGKNDFHKN